MIRSVRPPRRFASLCLATFAVLCVVPAGRAIAQSIGGVDATTEDFTSAASWAPATPATPGGSPSIGSTHLLISEIGMRGWNTSTLTDSTEFIEIYNPG